MRRIVSLVLLIAGAAMMSGAGGQSSAADRPPGRAPDPAERAARVFAREHPFLDAAIRVGERLTYSVRYGPIRAGTATIAVEGIEVVAGDSCYHVVTTAESNDFFSTFFYVRDRVESYMRVSDLRPRRFEKYLLEGNYRNETIVDFDPEAHLASYSNGRHYEVLPGTHDILSAFFDVRSRDLQVGDEIFLDCHVDRENYPLKTTVLARERIDVPIGEFDCLAVEPILRTPGLFKHEGSLTIWFSDDPAKVPVKMSSSLPIGSISVVLVEIEGRRGWEHAR
jgi:hypothetical protein